MSTRRALGLDSAVLALKPKMAERTNSRRFKLLTSVMKRRVPHLCIVNVNLNGHHLNLKLPSDFNDERRRASSI